MPAEAKNVAGSSLPIRPWWETVSIFTVWPDLMVSAGGRSAVRYPQITVAGVERSVASGVAFGGTVCAPAEQVRPAIMQATKQLITIDINEVRIDDLPGKSHGDDHGINGRAFTMEQPHPQIRGRMSGLAQSFRDRRQAYANAIREIGRCVGRLRGRVDQRAPAQLVERQRGVDPARVVEVAVDEAIEEMADVEPALPACGIQVAYDVDRAAVAREMLPFWPGGKLVGPVEVDRQQLAYFLHVGVETVKVDGLPAVGCAHRHDVMLIADHVDQLELLEQRGDRIEALAHLRPCLDGDAQRRCVVEDEAHEGVPHQPLGPIGHIEIEPAQV